MGKKWDEYVKQYPEIAADCKEHSPDINYLIDMEDMKTIEEIADYAWEEGNFEKYAKTLKPIFGLDPVVEYRRILEYELRCMCVYRAIEWIKEEVKKNEQMEINEGREPGLQV